MIKHFFNLATFLALFMILIGCTENNINNIESMNIYKMKSFSVTSKNSLREINDTKIINIFYEAINNASIISDSTDMVDPQYKIEIGNDTYFLWLYENSGILMNDKDSHTTFSISEKSVKEINSVLANIY
ncbi:hypothetical protein CIB95_12995 [Lottiidibacillus patelloidae]|uniref:YhfM-like domain-containing protein n=1 Tax=Lottiidibacillus patelloidae TaxID=2670334 RepID=A0A263BRK4_9BACI|nr:hypothetical protein [Lottiidibacillus patelloidae]OZM56325.1 hypothetical protein CIB95_12995 [Lottiidibacillus patelloidae]